VERLIACPECGAPAEPGQELCLRCGGRISREYRRSPSWVGPAILAAVGVLLIGAGIGFGVSELTKGKSHKAPRRPAVATRPTLRMPTGPATVLPGQSAPTSPGGATTPKKPPAPVPLTPGGGRTPGRPSVHPTPPTHPSPTSWPTGKSAYTVVLASASTRSAAESKARQATGRGISAGVLNSSNYSSLRPGYWVTFAGQFSSASAASSAAKRYASQGFPSSYGRFVKPKPGH
jgi:hypothetical protein